MDLTKFEDLIKNADMAEIMEKIKNLDMTEIVELINNTDMTEFLNDSNNVIILIVAVVVLLLIICILAKLIVLVFKIFFALLGLFFGSGCPKEIRDKIKGKSKEQAKVIKYFELEGCLSWTISDKEYLNLVRNKRDAMNPKQKALNKIGLDEEDVNEISPVMFEGFVYKTAKYVKQIASGKWVSSSYQVSWIFFSSSQIYIYSCTFNMDDDKTTERTDEFFYKDVTSFSTYSESSVRTIGDKTFEVNTEQFALVVPGDKLFMAMGDIQDADAIIQGMKQKLREKKMR